MRVIAGACRGLKLNVPTGMNTRPTSDRVKESLFSILGSRIDLPGLRVLDVCAGTGSLGIEALSRGAASCCFIESDSSVGKILEKNLAVTRLGQQAEVLISDAVKGLTSLVKRGALFDLIFFDPPYESLLYTEVLTEFSIQPLLAVGAIIVVECASRNCLPDSTGGLMRIERRVYGDTALDFFKTEEPL